MKIRTHISKALSLLTSAAIAVGCIPALELPAAAESSDTSQVSLSKNQKTYGDGWFWNGESLLIYGASFDVPENTAYFGEFKGFGAGETINVLVEGLNEITLADGAVFVDSDQNPISVDGSSYMKVSGSGVLFSGADADYYGGVINAQGAVTLFDAPTLVIKGGQVLAPEGTVISDGGNQASSLGIESANVKAKSYGAAKVSGLKSHLEFPEGCGEIANLNLDTCTAYISGTDFTTNFDFKQSVVIFQDVSIADAASLKVNSDYSSYDTDKGGTVFCNEFLSGTRYSVGDYDVGVLSEGSHSGMYYDGSQALRVPAKSTITGANYITSPNRVVLVVGSVDSVTRSANINDASDAMMNRAPLTPVANNDAYVTDAVITAISTGKGGVTQYYAANGAISLYRVSLTNSSLFADGVETIRALLAEGNTPSSFISVGEEKGQILISTYEGCKYDFTGNIISGQYCGISCSSIGGRATSNGFGFDFDAVIDGKFTDVLGKGVITSIQIRNGSYWCGESSNRLTPSTSFPNGRVFVHPDAKDTTYIYSALSGTDKYYEYTQLPLNTDNKFYIGRQIYEPYINVIEPKNKTLTRGGTTEIAYVTYGCTDPALEWVNADGKVISTPDGITASLGDTSIDRKVSITTGYDVPEETVRFRIRSEDGKNIVSNVLELTTGKYNFMMDFRDSKFRKKWKFGVEVTDPANNYAGTNWRWYGKDTTENGVSYKAKTLVLEDGFSHVTDSEACRVGIALPDGATLIVAGDCEVQAYTMPIKCEGSLTVINSGDKRNTISLLFTHDGILEAPPADPNTDQFQYPRIPGCFETAGDLSVTGCDIKSDVGSSQYLKAYGSMELADMSLTVPDGTPMATPTALYAEGRLLIKPDVMLDTLPAIINFGSLKIGEVSELSELTDLSDNTVYGAEDLVSMPAASALYRLSSNGNPLKLVTTPLTADNTLEKLQFCKDVYGASSGTIDLNDLGAVSGGSGKYKFAPVGSLPSWLSVKGDDSVKFDIPNNDMEQTSVKFTVTDADPELAISGDGAELTLNFGPVNKVYFVRYYKPENGTITVTSSALGKTVETSEASGRILCETPVIPGEDAVVTIRPDRGFRTSGIEIDGSHVVPDKALSVEGTMTFSAIDADHSVSAVFSDAGASGFEEYCTLSLDSSLENIADRFSLKYTESGKTVTKPLSEPQTVRTGTEIKITADTGTEYYLENASMGGSDITLNFDSIAMSFSCELTVEKSALFKADYGELCKVELSYDPDSSTISSETRDFGGYIPKGDTYKFSILTKNKYTIAEVYNALDQSQELAPVSVDRNEDERVYHYEWVITGDASWTPVINPPRVLTVNCGEHGTVTSADDTYANGDTVTLTVTADPGYYVKSTELNGTAVSLNSDNEYVFTIESDSTFTAEFAEIPPDSYVVTVNCGEHGTVTPGTADYESGTEVTFTVTPDSGYRVKSVTLDGKAVTLTNGKYTFKVTANCTFEAEFEAIPADRYTVTVKCGEHGTVTPGTADYESGTEVTLTVTPDSGYRVKSVTLDSKAVTLTNGKYTFKVTANCTFEAEFEAIPADRYTVTVKCGEHGAVTPGTADYESGTEVTLTVTPDSGYRVKSVTLDGKTVTLTNGKYTFKVTANCTFEAEFVKKGGSSGGTGGSGGSSGGSAGGSSTRSLPVINGIEKSWQSIVSDISRLPEGGSAVIALNGETVVPVEVVRAISDVKAKVEFVVSTAKSWMIDGAKITTVCAADFTALPGIAEKTSLRGVNGAAFKGGDTGVPAVLKLTFRKEFAGQFANVYKLADNRLVFLQCVKITADGTALISGVNAAGEYAVMVCEYSDLIGDINNDGVLNALDASAILRHITGIFEGVNILFADFNNDGTVNALDASAILKAIIE